LRVAAHKASVDHLSVFVPNLFELGVLGSESGQCLTYGVKGLTNTGREVLGGGKERRAPLSYVLSAPAE
jgi:hypothetical protein